MKRMRLTPLLLLVAAALLAGCATRPTLPPITQAEPGGYRFETRTPRLEDKETMVILAFSGGGTRAAAFSYGVLEFLARTEVRGPDGRIHRLLDAVDVITGVSGGSFTALAYGLYGDRLFAEYEQRFLKRNVQGEIVSRTFDPTYWGKLWSTAWGRSELAADLYDEILFNGATYADLQQKKGPLILASATDISTGSRFVFSQGTLNFLCADLLAMKLSRAAAASSAVPVVLSPVTVDNHGGTCGAALPPWARAFTEAAEPPRPAARAIRTLKSLEAYQDGVHRPFIHLVDGGVSDNVGMRGVLDTLELLEALHDAGKTTPLDRVKRIVVFIVNSLSSPPTDWDESEAPPGTHRHPAEGDRRADRPLLLRGGRAAEGHRRAVGEHARHPQFGGDGGEQGSRRRGRGARAGRRDLRRRCLVCPAQEPDRARLSQPAAHVVRAAGRGGRPAAGRRGNDHPVVAGLPAAAEGPRGARRGSARGCKGAAGGARSPVARRVGAGCISVRKSNGHRIGCPSSRSRRPARQTRRRYSPVRVSISILSPVATNSGTCTSKPLAILAGFSTLPDVSPLTAGSV